MARGSLEKVRETNVKRTRVGLGHYSKEDEGGPPRSGVLL